jgi:hypothetical protein
VKALFHFLLPSIMVSHTRKAHRKVHKKATRRVRKGGNYPSCSAACPKGGAHKRGTLVSGMQALYQCSKCKATCVNN